MSTPSQDVQAKAARYLLTRKVRLHDASGDYFAADVHGDHGTHGVTYSGYTRQWYCTCPATVTCAHILACQTFWAPADRPDLIPTTS